MNTNQIVSPKVIALVFGVLVISFAVAFYVVAWQEPSQAPPGGNVAAPLNTGSAGQSKAGGLILNTGGAVNGLIIDKGNLCLGASCRNTWPETGVVQAYHMSATATSYAWQQKTYNCPEGTAAIQTYCKSAPYTCGGSVIGQGCGCSVSGRTAILTAYVALISRPCGDCVSPCCPSYNPGSTCSAIGYCDAYCLPSVCEMEFQCGMKTEVGQ